MIKTLKQLFHCHKNKKSSATSNPLIQIHKSIPNPYNLPPPYQSTNASNTSNHQQSTIFYAKCGAQFMSLDFKIFFLATPMQTAEYIRVSYKYFPNDIRQKYSLSQKVLNDPIYIEIKKEMYGLKRLNVLAYNNLIKN